MMTERQPPPNVADSTLSRGVHVMHAMHSAVTPRSRQSCGRSVEVNAQLQPWHAAGDATLSTRAAAYRQAGGAPYHHHILRVEKLHDAARAGPGARRGRFVERKEGAVRGAQP